MAKKKAANWQAPSKGARRVHDALKMLGAYDIVPEFAIGERMHVDFVICQLNWAIEVNGTQHTQFNNHFFEDRDAFNRAQMRDEKKREMCVAAGYTFISLDYPEIMKTKSPQELLDLIVRRAQETNGKTEGQQKQNDDAWGNDEESD